MMTYSHWVFTFSLIIIAVFGVISIYQLRLRKNRRLCLVSIAFGIGAMSIFLVIVHSAGINVKKKSFLIHCTQLYKAEGGGYVSNNEEANPYLKTEEVDTAINNNFKTITKYSQLAIETGEKRIYLRDFIEAVKSHEDRKLMYVQARII